MASRPTTAQRLDAGRALVADWQASGLTMAGYARQRGVGAHRIKYWRNRLRQMADPSGFVEAVPAPVAPEVMDNPERAAAPGVYVRSADGVTLEIAAGADPDWVGRVVAALTC